MYRVVIPMGPRPLNGSNFRGIHQARRAATQTLGAMLRGDPEELWASEVLSVIVQDEGGLTLFSVDAVGTDAPAANGQRPKAGYFQPAGRLQLPAYGGQPIGQVTAPIAPASPKPFAGSLIAL